MERMFINASVPTLRKCSREIILTMVQVFAMHWLISQKQGAVSSFLAKNHQLLFFQQGNGYLVFNNKK